MATERTDPRSGTTDALPSRSPTHRGEEAVGAVLREGGKRRCLGRWKTEPRGGRYEDVAPLEKYIEEDGASATRDARERVSRGGPSFGKGKPSHRGTDRRGHSEGERGRRPRTKPRDPEEEQREEGAADGFEEYRHTDAYRNTMREFEASSPASPSDTISKK